MRIRAYLEVEVEINGGHVVPQAMALDVVRESLKDAVEFRGKEGIEHDLATTPFIRVVGFTAANDTTRRLT